jgi:hypothetical protein
VRIVMKEVVVNLHLQRHCDLHKNYCDHYIYGKDETKLSLVLPVDYKVNELLVLLFIYGDLIQRLSSLMLMVPLPSMLTVL